MHDDNMDYSQTLELLSLSATKWKCLNNRYRKIHCNYSNVDVYMD